MKTTQKQAERIIRQVKALLPHAETHCPWCDAPHTGADRERNRCPRCGDYLDPFGK